MLEFDYPWIFFLVLAPLLMRWVLPTHRETRQAVFVPYFDQLVKLSGQEPGTGAVVPKQPLIQQVVLILAWCLIVIALARPQWIQDPIEKTIPTRDLLLAVDLSGSMDTEDFTDPQGNQTDRLTAVKQVLDDFLTRRRGDRVGLIFFGSAAFVQVPFTEDLDTCRTLLEEAQVRMAGPRTMLGDAIGLAISVFKRSPQKEQVLIALTDGSDTGSKVPPEKAADIARDNEITIHTIAVGDPQATGEEKIDEETLKSIAAKTGGGFFRAQDREALEDIYRRLDQLDTREIQTISHRPKRGLFHWPLGASILLTLLFHLFMALKTWGRRIQSQNE